MWSHLPGVMPVSSSQTVTQSRLCSPQDRPMDLTEEVLRQGRYFNWGTGRPRRWHAQFSCSLSDTLRPHGVQHTRLPCPSPTPRACSNSCPLSRWCRPTMSASVIPFSSCLQSFPGSGFFPVSQFFASGGQSIGASASSSVFPMNIQNWW